MAEFITVGKITDIPTGQARVVMVHGHRVALCNVDGSFYAVDDTCTHDDGPLGEGTLDGFAIQCPRHGARFDVRTGAVVRMPAAFPIRSYKTRVENGHVQVEWEDAHR